MNTYLLNLCSYQQARRLRVLQNILTNRRTVANLFWGQQYGLLKWLGARRQLCRAEFDQEVESLVQAGLLEREVENEVRLTAAGVHYQEAHPAGYQAHFLDWYWLANTNQVQQRFLLGFQVVSEFAHHNRRYVPLAVPFADQQAVREWFHHFYSPRLVPAAYRELHELGDSLAGEDPRLATALVNLLIGHGQAGWTSDQLAQRLTISLADQLVLTHDLFLAVSAYAKQTNGPLANLIKPLLSPAPLSQSNLATVQLFQDGLTVDQVACQRGRKLSTIREHLLTAAILMPQLLDWNRLLPAAVADRLRKAYPGPVVNWRFASWTGDANRDFFYFRLFQIWQGRRQRG